MKQSPSLDPPESGRPTRGNDPSEEVTESVYPSSVVLQEIFHAAIERPSDERPAFLEAACGDDSALRERVEHLLAAYERSEAIFEPPHSPEIEREWGRLKPEGVGDSIGRYKLREKLGEGGFGTVWVAEQENPVKRRVALKIIKLGMDTREVIARFEQERQALAMMDHPSIAKVFDAGATQFGRPFFVMELVRGIKITEYCDRQEISTRERLELFIVVCQAVQHAHQKGIIHRDLKPSNILVTLHDGVPVPKVIDFGVAKATQSRLTDRTIYTQFQQLIGTPLYMSPEQAEMGGLDVDTRSDIYSLGVLLYELLTGRTPFNPDTLRSVSLDEIRRIIREKELPKPSTVLDTMALDIRTIVAKHRHTEPPKLVGLLRGDLDWIVMKALEKDRTRRYETANGLAMDIGRHLANEPVLARPPSRLYRFRRFVQRHKAGVASGASIAAALVLGITVSISQMIRADKNAARANDALAKLANTAPAFAAQGRELVIKEDFKEAITKLTYAIELQPTSVEYLRDRAALLQSLRRLSEAAADFRRILELLPGDTSAQANAELCERLAAGPRDPGGGLPRASVAELYAAMNAEHRPAVELMPLALALGNERTLLREYWLDRLRLLPNASGTPISERLKAGEHGTLELDLRGTKIADLSPLRGMPLERLDISECSEVRSIDVLKDMPLRELNLEGTGVTSLEPLAGVRTLEDLRFSSTTVADLTPLHGLPLRKLEFAGTKVMNLSALKGMPLTALNIGNTRVTDLSPLIGMPLKQLECSYTPVGDCMPLATLPLERLILRGVPIGNLVFVRDLPLKVLDLGGAPKVIDLGALRNVKTLEVLVLPGNPPVLSDDEIVAIELLKDHPTLRQISYTLAEGSSPESAEAATVFWRKWEMTMAWWRPLRAAGITVTAIRGADDTWQVHVPRQPIRDLSMFAGALNLSQLNLDGCSEVADLSPLRGLQLKTLSIGHTAVTDLSPLKDMRLQNLWMSDTKVTDLSALRGMPLKILYMNECSLLTDLSPLLEMPELEEVLLPENAVEITHLKEMKKLRRISYTFDLNSWRPASAVAEFWAQQHDLKWLPALRAAGALLSAEQLADGTWKVSLRGSSFSDLSLLKGAHISELSLFGTGVTELRPLVGLPLRVLRLDDTPCSDVSPLARIPALESVVLPRDALDVTALQKLPGLKRLDFDVDATGAPKREVNAFWAELERKSRP